MHTISVSAFGSGDCSSFDSVLEVHNTFAFGSDFGSLAEMIHFLLNLVISPTFLLTSPTCLHLGISHF